MLLSGRISIVFYCRVVDNTQFQMYEVMGIKSIFNSFFFADAVK